MGLNTEWMTVDSVLFEVMPKGVEIGEDTVTEEYAIVLSQDARVVIEGSYVQLIDLLYRVKDELWREACRDF